MALFVTVQHIDGTKIRTRIGPATEVAFERHFRKAWSAAFQEELPYNEYIYFAAWHSATVEKKASTSFEDWLLTLESWEMETDGADPSSAAAPLGS